MTARWNGPRPRVRNERGLSMTPFVVVIMAALIMTAGLVIDGGQKVAAASRAETAAAGASRATRTITEATATTTGTTRTITEATAATAETTTGSIAETTATLPLIVNHLSLLVGVVSRES